MQYKQIKICEPYVIWLTKYLQSSVHSLIFFSGVVLLFFPCIRLLLVYSNFGQASVYKIKEYNRKCDNRICWNCRFKIQCRKNGQKIGLFSSWVKNALKKKKNEGALFLVSDEFINFSNFSSSPRCLCNEWKTTIHK